MEITYKISEKKGRIQQVLDLVNLKENIDDKIKHNNPFEAYKSVIEMNAQFKNMNEAEKN